MNYKTFYKENKDFRDYVDKYAANYNEARSITVDEALTHLMIHNVAEWYFDMSKRIPPDPNVSSAVYGC